MTQMYLTALSTTQHWLKIVNEFEEEWDIPHCIGAIDGKHVAIESPQNGGCSCYNYKEFHSIVIMAVCDAKYWFTLVDIGAQGGNNDAAVLAESKFGKAFEHSPASLNLPKPGPVDNTTLAYVILRDDAFPLKPWLMKPFPAKGLYKPQRIYNYRL